MRLRLHSTIPSLYLFLCIVLGGSAQGWWTNISIQVLGIAMMVWAGVVYRSQHKEHQPVAVYAMLLAGISVVLLQLLPLPPWVWTRLPGRETISLAFSQLGYAYPALPVSETPQESVLTLFAAIPAISAFVAIERLRPSPRWLAFTIIAGTMLAILVGALQVAGGPDSPVRFYPISNSGAVGFFANQNHMATLLLVTIPLIAATTSSRGKQHSRTGVYGLAIILLVLILVGIALNGSFAAAILVVPVVLASVVLVPAWARWRRLAIPCAIIALFAGIALLASKPITGTATAEESTAFTTRTEIWSTTFDAISQTFPVGTGLGSFQQVYRQLEEPSSVKTEYINHAHNDYLELVLELGVPGVLLLLAFILWWASTTVRIWSSPLTGRYARAATIVTAAVLAHSFVDFPLRTAAISAIFAASIALMGTAFESDRVAGRSKLRPARHVKIA